MKKPLTKNSANKHKSMQHYVSEMMEESRASSISENESTHTAPITNLNAFLEYLRNEIEFKNIDLIEEQVGVLIKHMTELIQQRGEPNKTIISIVPLVENADQVLDESPKDKSCENCLPRGDNERKWVNVAKKSSKLTSEDIQLNFVAPEIREVI